MTHEEPEHVELDIVSKEDVLALLNANNEPLEAIDE